MGFKIADQLAEELGIASDAPERFRAGLVHSLLTLSLETGDTYVEAKELLQATIQLLEASRPVELDPASVAQEIGQSHRRRQGAKQLNTKIFNNSLFFAEEGIRSHIGRLLEKGKQDLSKQKKIEQTIDDIEEDLQYPLRSHPTEGYPGSHPAKGLRANRWTRNRETTVINGIIGTYARLHQLDLRIKSQLPILLAAPTGRAARRMSELTGLPSATIHRHLGMTGDDDTSHLDDYLDADFIIVDEFSMVDTWLANQLLSNISSNTKLLIVGDADQLPSVSPGQVLSDLLQIPSIPQVKLEHIFRQSEDSTIVTLASQIRKGQTAS